MNTRNKFHLQKLLEVRELIERKRQKELAECKKQIVTEQEKLSELNDTKTNFSKGMDDAELLTASGMLAYHEYLSELRDRIAVQNQALQNLSQQEEQKRQALLESAQDRKILEKLREKVMERMQAEENQREQKQLDEIAGRQRYSVHG